MTDKQYRQHLNKLDKLKKIQLIMVNWLESNRNQLEKGDVSWQERMSYVLSCEKKELNKDDIKMLNNIYKFYGNESK